MSELNMEPCTFREKIEKLEAENAEFKEELEYFVPAFMDTNNELIESANRISELEVALKFYEDNCDCCRDINIEGADSEGGKDE